MSHSPLVEKAVELLHQATRQAPVLDLACGSGRNGLYLVNQNIPVVFADIKESALEQVENAITRHHCEEKSMVNFWQIDFEQDNLKPLADKSFSAVIVFRYLHRPLFEQIKQAVISGGYVVYETFTVDQPQFGRPKNPDFLLKHGELAELFADWHIIYSFEGVIDAKNAEVNNGSGKQAIAQIIARKPLL
ncbi:methyltransferase domain-containing protein [Colwellia psychrerythraea]|uniref:Tellurite resistance methyltransferase, TehB, core n=1 Tax=Colwellia psychrerythraea TaxID=28229 RepID=A0A099KNI9_COLPS|nr:methyltransferase domain-containing protein [Colwellia psychrerythraea]KGJ92031.1 Tellurite resistance methyltransferase, TehB, core [Colwellia psychrerythraea]